MGNIRDKFVRETEEEKKLYKTVQSFRSGNPFYSFSSQMDSTEKIHSFLEQKVSSLITEQVQLAGTRWSLHANEKQTKTYNIAGFAGFIMFDVLDCICQWAANDICQVQWMAKKDSQGEFKEVMLVGPQQIVRVHIATSPCIVPKKIKNSRTDGIRIDSISWENDCALWEFFGEKNAEVMQETLLKLWMQSALGEIKLCPYYETQEEFSSKVKKIQEAAGKYLEEQEKLEKQESFFEAAEENIHPWRGAKLNEVIVTRSEKAVLDIGLVDYVADDGRFTVLASPSYNGEKRYYGGVEYCNWHHTGFFLSGDEWKEISQGKSASQICEILGIPYRNTEDLISA